MEMIPIVAGRMRSRRQSSTYGREPLLEVNARNDNDAFDNEWFPPIRTDKRYPQVDMLLSPSVYYHATRLPGIPVKQQSYQERAIDFPSLVDASQGPSLIHHIHHHLLDQKNPAKDLSIPLISHGGLCCQCVRTQEIGLTENFGKFDNLLGPGLYILCWPYSTIASRVSLRIQQLDASCETKTKDHVFVHMEVSVQYRVIPEMAYLAFYRLADSDLQIRSYILDVVRTKVPSMTLDDVFSSRQDIAHAVHTQLNDQMRVYGFHMVNTLCTNVRPSDATLRFAMNDVAVWRRKKEAMMHHGLAAKFSRVKQAEAAVEASYLHGVGVARGRKCIVDGMKESVKEGWNGEDFSHVMNVLLVTQYMDLLCNVGARSLVVRASPGELKTMSQGLISFGTESNLSSVNTLEDDDNEVLLVPRHSS